MLYEVITIIRVLDHPAEPNPDWSGATPDPGSSTAPWRVYNIGNSQPVELMDYIAALEKALGNRITSYNVCYTKLLRSSEYCEGNPVSSRIRISASFASTWQSARTSFQLLSF